MLKFKLLILVSFVLLIHSPCMAQWFEQSVELKEGWNAIYLQVDPYPQECQLLTKDLPIKSIWYYNQNFSPVQFILDPSELSPNAPEWQSFHQTSLPEAINNDLFILSAGKCYLIEATESFTWTIKGKAKHIDQQWTPDSYNLVGFHVDPQNPPTFSAWFQSSPAHNPLELWTLDTNQNWVQIQNTDSSTIEPSKAYWVKCNGVSNYQGPIQIDLSEGREINFFRISNEFDIELINTANRNASVTINLADSLEAPQPIQEAYTEELYPVAGPVPLKYFGRVENGDNVQIGYVNLPASYELNSNDTSPELVELSVDRTQMAPYNGDIEARYQSILEIRDGQGFLKKIGVVSEGIQVNSEFNVAGFSTRQVNEQNPHTGLWVGFVELHQVQEPNLDILTETPATFDFRIIVHMDAEGTCRLLNEVTQLWHDGTYKPDPLPNNPNATSVDQPGRFILLTPTAPESLLNELRIGENVRPSGLRDGRPFARRISSAMFSLLDENQNPEDPPMALDGSFGQDGGELSVVLVLENTDPQNPFHHQYHPQHAYPEEGDTVVPRNDWTITREISLEFSSDYQGELPPAGWGDSFVGGIYREVLTGLKNEPFQVAGTFELSRVSTVPVLNDGDFLAEN